MRTACKTMAVMATLLLLTAGSQGAFADCTNFGAGFPISQCGSTSAGSPRHRRGPARSSLSGGRSTTATTTSTGIGGTAPRGHRKLRAGDVHRQRQRLATWS